MKKIFYVDDDLLVRRSFKRMLERCRPDDAIIDFDCPEDLLKEVMEGRRPDMVVTDRDMPGMTGETLASHLKHGGFNGPVVMITGNATMMTPPPYVDELAFKPIGLKDLSEMVARYLDPP